MEHAFRGSKSLATLDGSPGLTARKVKGLRRLGREAAGETSGGTPGIVAGRSSAETVGEFARHWALLGRSHPVARAGAPDLLLAKEPRLGRAIAMAYGLDAPPPRKNSDGWPWAGAPTGRG